jgi:hypothetical protein
MIQYEMIQFSHVVGATFLFMLVFQQPIVAKSIEKTGKCTKGAIWELWLSPNRKLIHVHFAGKKSILTVQNWRIIVQNNKKTVFNTTVSEGDGGNDHGDTGEENGMKEIFHIDAKILTGNGNDNLVFRATSSKTKETCRFSHIYTS